MNKRYSPRHAVLVLALAAVALSANAQQFQSVIQDYLRKEKAQWNLTDGDISQWTVSDQYTNKSTGITYTYLHQQVAGIRIFNAVSTMAIKDEKVVHFANRFHPNAAAQTNTAQPALSAEQAIAAAAAHLGLTLSETPRLLNTETNRQRYTYSRAGIAGEDIRVELVWVPVEENLRLAWNVVLAPLKSSDWWNIRLDAQTGAFLEKNNWTTYCDFGPAHHHGASETTCSRSTVETQGTTASQSGSYNVFPLPIEAPNFGGRSMVTDPASPDASPYGWHDTDGNPGAEYTITRGNNVHAYEDLQDLNQPGNAPDGGQALVFDFPLDLTVSPVESQDAILTNLFYMNNVLHDVLYLHGFDEPAGNFQQTNYTGQGLDEDYVRAEGQDGGGTNNANFSTPDDGLRGRMQMYLWPEEEKATMQVTAPQAIAGSYFAVKARLGEVLEAPLTGFAVLAVDSVGPVNDGCQTILNAAELNGKIAVIDLGFCLPIIKINEAHAAGAVAVIIINNTTSNPYALTGNSTGDIPAIMISKADGDLLKAQLNAGVPVEVTMRPAPARDGSLDNGIIAHEYGHGLSNRLTGGPSNSDCLNNQEQGGEGWSDWLALVLTIEPGDAGTDVRGIGTFALDDNGGVGIRRYPYSTDMSVNPLTYDSVNTSSGVHARGEIWSQTLWEMTWMLIDLEGFDPDWYNGDGGNNTALRLVIEGMKLQPCRPGYLDARDAILKADELLYQNAHRCLIWEAFAKRGMGAYAVQGSNNDATDQQEDFTIPPTCLSDIVAPNANFVAEVASKCGGSFRFKDQTENLVWYHTWNFGDGTTSDVPNPTHTYAAPGVYTVTLIVSNNIGADTVTQTVTYEIAPAPAVSGNQVVCEGGSVSLTAEVLPGYQAQWLLGDSAVYNGNTFLTPPVTGPVTYTVQQLKQYPNLKVGAVDNTTGTGGNHNAPAYEGKLFFTTYAPLTLNSVLVYAQGGGNRTFRLRDADGILLKAVTVFVPAGAQRVNLNFDIPTEGNYSLSANAQNLYRITSGATYPYVIDNLIAITSSGASPADALNYYFYLFDWEVQEKPCNGTPAEVTLTSAPGPVAAFTTAVNNLTATFTNTTTGNATVQTWNFGDGSPISTELNPTHTYSQPGTYDVELTVTNGSCLSSYRQTVQVGTSSVAGVDDAFGLKVFPNPATDQVTLEFLKATDEPLEVKITGADGRVVLARSLAPQTTRVALNTASLPAGAYQVLIIGATGVSVQSLAVVR